MRLKSILNVQKTPQTKAPREIKFLYSSDCTQRSTTSYDSKALPYAQRLCAPLPMGKGLKPAGKKFTSKFLLMMNSGNTDTATFFVMTGCCKESALSNTKIS